MNNEELCKQGICADCGANIEPMTDAEIKKIKDDLGMDETDDLSNVCDECQFKYLPASELGLDDTALAIAYVGILLEDLQKKGLVAGLKDKFTDKCRDWFKFHTNYRPSRELEMRAVGSFMQAGVKIDTSCFLPEAA